MWRSNLDSPGYSHLGEWQGSGEEQTEPYMQYGEGAPELVTQPIAKSNSRVTGSASKQADAMRKARGVSEHAGFPNAATDKSLADLDLHQLLVKRPVSTFFMVIEGRAWEEQGIFNGDLVLADRGLSPKRTDKLVWWAGDSFVIGSLGQMPEETEEWGVVTAIVHRYRT